MLTIERARFPQDALTVGSLVLGYISFLLERSPEERDNIRKNMTRTRSTSLWQSSNRSTPARMAICFWPIGMENLLAAE